jgi:uroporphyrinogen-III synthase
LTLFDTEPLIGRRVLVTRSAGQAGRLSEALRAVGAEPVEISVLEIVPPKSYAALDEAVIGLADFEWLVLASVNAVDAVRARCSALGVRVDSLDKLKVAVVGAATADRARAAGFDVALVPESFVAEALGAALAGHVQGQRVLLARAAVARDVLPDALAAAGAELIVVEAYRTCVPGNAAGMLRQVLDVGVDAATFTSSSSVRNLAAVAAEAGLVFPLPGMAGISIGPVTSATMREFEWEPMAEAAVSDVPGLVAAVVLALGR